MLRNVVRVRAYSSSANLGPGFDILAVAHTAFFDEVEVWIDKGCGNVYIESISGPFGKAVNRFENTAAEALRSMIDALGLEVDVYVRLWKGIPVGKGLGSSGASAAAAVKALNDVLSLGLPPERLVLFAGIGERVAAGEPHFDNVAASIMGGFVALVNREPIEIVKWDLSAYIVVAVPDVDLGPSKTALMRSIVPRLVELERVVVNYMNLVKIVLGLERKSLRMIGEGMNDTVVEKARAPYIPCYERARKAALSSGALGVALSGAGPSIVAICGSREEAERVAKGLSRAYEECGVGVKVVVARPAPGAHEVK